MRAQRPVNAKRNSLLANGFANYASLIWIGALGAATAPKLHTRSSTSEELVNGEAGLNAKLTEQVRTVGPVFTQCGRAVPGPNVGANQ
jgi:hypothetical protein